MQPISAGDFRLTPLTAGDAARMYDALLDPALYYFVPASPPETLEALASRFARLETRRSPNGEEQWLNWVVERADTGAPAGLVEITVLPTREAFVGYFVFREFWGQGAATQALKAVLAHLTDVYGVKIFRAEADVRNAASLRVLEKAGFYIAEFAPQADFFKGTRSDEFRLVKVVA